MTLEIYHGTVTWDGVVIALNDDPVSVIVDGVEVYQATGHDTNNSAYQLQWDYWEPEWSALQHAADWPTPTTVLAL